MVVDGNIIENVTSRGHRYAMKGIFHGIWKTSACQLIFMLPACQHCSTAGYSWGVICGGGLKIEWNM